MKFIKSELAKQKWYRQGAAVKFWYISVPWSASHSMTAHGRPIKLRQKFIGYVAKDFVTLFLAHMNAEEIARWHLARQRRDLNTMARQHRAWQKKFMAFRDAVIGGQLTQGLRRLSDGELLRRFRTYATSYHSLWREAIFHDSFDLMGERFLETALRDFGLTLTSDELEMLTTNDEAMPIQIERIALARLASGAKPHPALRRLIKRRAFAVIGREFLRFAQELHRHSQRYFWIHNDYAHVKRLNEKFFLNAVRELIGQPKKLQTDRQLLRTIARNTRRKKALEKRLKLPHEVLAVTRLLSVVGQWRDERKAMNQLGDELMRRYAIEFSRRSTIPLADVEYASWWDAWKLLRPSADLRRQLRERRRGAFYAFSGPFILRVVTGRRSEQLLAFMNSLIMHTDLAGRTAYPGTARGVARLMLGQKDFKRFHRGDVLIAPNTRPEYVPIMKIAGAIVTEEGGITSHAAIVSRELKIPAVVGVQGILDAVKDGDMVEVDANNGVVRKVK
ncbi:hypothetical protein A3H10_01125 [Candidatus Uhrbacteria bacterium RIFCSPLOWO2_12_FULL_46_10]|nr:MAG: Phosphoenolpyruvate synthase [Parcubacteria group bacterium GW2011_GWA2_46_9]OGL60209.1 MAG: hypothetical protein A2752_01080 [Candidatus Uhrbacteria bacterium RIFCSPHIGHO2_01_FULL_46_23]OGL76517.1 MAG: hypothetical protein A3E96_03205 [Candidatus Uhrbacteria bacterium RIFCSPHIGHO2_12_FULL_46_13]OGL91353.1 MAG: hypothetical protein A3H10_01125 [Candidatus Uhrbacteria bacterium RIFCSPLOWO2_12_FULL_46_10]